MCEVAKSTIEVDLEVPESGKGKSKFLLQICQVLNCDFVERHRSLSTGIIFAAKILNNRCFNTHISCLNDRIKKQIRT